MDRSPHGSAGDVKGMLWDWVPYGLPTVAAAVGLAVITTAFTNTGPLAILRIRTGRPAPESPGLLTRKKLEDYLARAGPDGRVLYRLALKLDFGFAVIYTIGLVWVLDGTIGVALSNPDSWRWLAALPLIAGVLDVYENLALLAAVPANEEQPVQNVSIAAGLSLGKWFAAGLTIILIAAGAVVLAIGGAGHLNPIPLLSPLAWTILILVFGAELSLAIRLMAPDAASWNRQSWGGAGHLLGAAIVLALTLGLEPSLEQFGLTFPSGWGPWWWGLGLGVVIALAVAALFAPGGRRFQDSRFELSTPRLAAKVLLLIPATVVFEELAFRGFLYGLWERAFQPSTAVGATAIAFGLWHITSALDRVKANPEPGAPAGQVRSAILGTVLFTAAAGIMFGVLRRESGSLWAPALVHWGANATGVIVVASAARKRARQK